MMKNSTKNTKRWEVRSKRTNKTVKSAATRSGVRTWKRNKPNPSTYYLFDAELGRTIR